MKTITYWIKNSIVITFLLTMTVSTAQTAAQRKEIVKNYDTIKLKELRETFAAQEALKREKVATWLKENNTVALTEIDGAKCELFDISSEGVPMYRIQNNAVSAMTNRADHLHTGGSTGFNLNGNNMIAAIWDLGYPRTTHQEFDGPGGNNRVSLYNGTTNGLNQHHTHTVGTICASGVDSSAKGIAPESQVSSHDWGSDLSEATTEASNGILVSNHSYGWSLSSVPDNEIGAYSSDARNWDNLMYNAPYYIAVESAGNDGLDNSSNGSPLGGNSSYDKLNGRKTSKNGLSVGNAHNASFNPDGSLATLSIGNYSSEGPTDELRVKPDIVAYGGGNSNNVYSTGQNYDSHYLQLSGTSMAAPSVVGSILLLQEHYNNENGNFMRAATVKGLILHTADDAGPNGPDPVFGWGLINNKKAAETISNHSTASVIFEETLDDTNTDTYTIIPTGGPLYVSISWTDLPGDVNVSLNSPATRLKNDLDLRVTQSGTDYFPWRLTGVTTNGFGDNDVDTFERVEIDNPSGTYTVTVSHKGNLVNNNSQDYTLIITGGIESSMSVSDNDTNLAITIYPNPTNENNTIYIEGDTSDLTYTITNAIGQQITSGLVENKQIDISEIANGIYYLNLKGVNNVGSKTEKIIISR